MQRKLDFEKRSRSMVNGCMMYILLRSSKKIYVMLWVWRKVDRSFQSLWCIPIFFYSGTKRSPHVRTAIMPPTKNPTAVATLMFPGSFSGEKTSVRKNLRSYDWVFFQKAMLERTLRIWTHLGRSVLATQTECEEYMMAGQRVLSDEPWCESRCVVILRNLNRLSVR